MYSDVLHGALEPWFGATILSLLVEINGHHYCLILKVTHISAVVATISSSVYTHMSISYDFKFPSAVTCPPYSANITADVQVSLISGSGINVGTVLSFSCSGDHHIEGDKTISCLSSGVWNGTIPVCADGGGRVNCPRLTLSNHLRKSSDNTSPNTVVSFSCDEGYTLEGPLFIRCSEDGNWNDTLPSCRNTPQCK